MTRLLDDQPATHASDKLRFDRTLNVIDRLVLTRRAPTGQPEAPFVVGLFGRWGSGKSTLLEMLATRLKNDPDQWEVIRFSPWTYRQQPALLVPLLATLVKTQPQPKGTIRRWFEKLIPKIADTPTAWFEKLIDLLVKKGGMEIASFTVAQQMLPLLALLQSLNSKRRKNEAAKDLGEQIEAIVRNITGGKKRLALLIDDLDRCHEPAQVVGLLEQIKLFLHIDNCLFFIAADRSQIIRAIEAKFPGEGERYLEKFVQLAIELPQPDGHDLLRLLPDLPAEDRACFARAAEVLGHNPRKLKALWNRAQICLALLREDLQGVTGLHHQATLPLMVRWLLIHEAGLCQDKPYALLELEDILNRHDSTNDARPHFDNWLRTHQQRRRKAAGRNLAPWLWHDRDTRFGSPAVLTLYLKATGKAHLITRQWLEQRLFDGDRQFSSVDFRHGDLRGVRLFRAEFTDCDFEGADLSGAELDGVSFIRCKFRNAKLDHASPLPSVTWTECEGLDNLDTDPSTYEKLADALVQQWERNPNSPPVLNANGDRLEALFKTYIRANKALRERNIEDEALATRLLEKSRDVREKIRQVGGG